MEGTRTYSWVDPQEMAKLSREMDGLEFSRHLLDAGEAGIMPIAATLGFRLAEIESGHAVLVGEVGEHLYNPIGIVHGGVAATLLDSAAGYAVQTTVPVGSTYTTLDLSVHYLRPLTADIGTLRATGHVINRGRRTALAHAEIRDAKDRLLAHATSSCMVFTTDA
ncbi:PaaI family thioesterase [Amycolatopsis sp. NPDC047767]|uniref:PaaI family thioesterase n=1 Tax=Amycolatopsis sp. NPDC047767 TaxID=3156765 RepID=UPI003453B556